VLNVEQAPEIPQQPTGRIPVVVRLRPDGSAPALSVEKVEGDRREEG
jgi:hypothetical protein